MGLLTIYLLKKNEIKQPSKTILISPWLDISMSNPNIDKILDLGAKTIEMETANLFKCNELWRTAKQTSSYY